MNTPRIKITASLKPDTVERLKSLAYDRGVTMAEAIDRAVDLEAFVSRVRKEGGKILIEDTGGIIRQVVRD